MPDWLPPLITLDDHDNDWNSYIKAVYEAFRNDFVVSRPTFGDQSMRLKRHPFSHNKEATFWHMVSSGTEEDSRVPDIRRCERIRWPRAIIEHYNDSEILAWRNERNQDKRILLFLQRERYLVVLNVRKGYVMPWTAFIVEREHRVRKLLKEYEEYKRTGASRLI
jgi:hypothetical protein